MILLFLFFLFTLVFPILSLQYFLQTLLQTLCLSVVFLAKYAPYKIVNI